MLEIHLCQNHNPDSDFNPPVCCIRINPVQAASLPALRSCSLCNPYVFLRWLVGSCCWSRWRLRKLQGALPGFRFAFVILTLGRNLTHAIGADVGDDVANLTKPAKFSRRGVAQEQNEPLAVLSNGHQVRILWAGADTSAWCESDSALWLVEGAPGPQLDALRLLLSPAALTPVEDKTGRVLSPLVRGILDSRKGQAELSALLGERVRLAVERLIQSHGPFLNALPNPPTRCPIRPCTAWAAVSAQAHVRGRVAAVHAGRRTPRR